VTSADFDPGLPTHVQELIASCVRFVHSSIGLELDFSHETLPLLDHYTIGARGELEARPEALSLVAQSLGAYFGQVLAVEFTGFWRASQQDSHSWLLCLQPVFLAINPVGVAYDVLTRGGRHDGPSPQLRVAREDEQFVADRLRSLPEENEDDYYGFATRFDALAAVVEALRGQMIDGGQEDVTFESSDYGDTFEQG
jgi:hypothetical protein